MISAAVSHHPELADRVHHHTLPEPLPFDSGTFSAVISMATLMHLERDAIPTVLAEFHRVLVPGGTAGISVSTERSGLNDQGRDAKGRHFTVLPAGQWADLMREAGFTIQAQWGNRDKTGRAGVAWTTLVGRR
jgi:SAM-dependent methyltransferase